MNFKFHFKEKCWADLLAVVFAFCNYDIANKKLISGSFKIATSLTANLIFLMYKDYGFFLDPIALYVFTDNDFVYIHCFL